MCFAAHTWICVILSHFVSNALNLIALLQVFISGNLYIWVCFVSRSSNNFFPTLIAREENVATFRGSEYFCYDLSQNPIQSSSDEITLSFKTWQRNGLILHTGKSADYVNLALKDGAVSLVINLGSGAFEAIVEPVNGKFNDNTWHDVKVTRNLRQVMLSWLEFHVF